MLNPSRPPREHPICQRGRPANRRHLPRPPQAGAHGQLNGPGMAVLHPAAVPQHVHHLAKRGHVDLVL
eukprot:11636763-Alexandrium_andersonii.AAC.1